MAINVECIDRMIEDICDYLDIVPNFKRTFVDTPENSWVFKSHAATDGKLYGFFGWDWNRDVNVGAVMYRKDIFDKHGIEMWNSRPFQGDFLIHYNFITKIFHTNQIISTLGRINFKHIAANPEGSSFAAYIVS